MSRPPRVIFTLPRVDHIPSFIVRVDRSIGIDRCPDRCGLRGPRAHQADATNREMPSPMSSGKEFTAPANPAGDYRRGVWACDDARRRREPRCSPPTRSSRRHSLRLTNSFTQPFPRRAHGRVEIRAELAWYETRSAGGRAAHAKSRYLLHAPADPEVSIVEIATVLAGPRQDTTMPLVQLFRIRAGTMPCCASTSHQGEWTKARVASGPNRVGDPSPRPVRFARLQCPALSVGRCRNVADRAGFPHTRDRPGSTAMA